MSADAINQTSNAAAYHGVYRVSHSPHSILMARILRRIWNLIKKEDTLTSFYRGSRKIRSTADERMKNILRSRGDEARGICRLNRKEK